MHPTDGLNRFAVIAVRTNDGDQLARRALPVRLGRADAAVNADRWAHRVEWVRLEPRVLLVQPVKTERQVLPAQQVQLEQQEQQALRVVRQARLVRLAQRA